MQSRRALHQWNAQWQRGTMRATAHGARCAVQEMLRVQRCCGGRRGLHNSAEPSSFAPPASETAVSAHDARLLADFIAPGGVVCVTGAGISTASGIPDYRSARGSYSKGHVPVQHMEFLSNEEKRKRYWARSLAGYKYFASRQPNSAHFAVAALQAAGLVTGVITQNVDQLHTHAGSGNVIDLHGTNDKVECQSCGARHERWAFQEEVEARNRAWILANLQGPGALGGAEVDIRADGDANLSHEDFRGFEVPGCRACGGVVMPTVVFFGGVIPKERKESAREMMRAASRILVLGTSCEVGSVFHLVRGALEKEPPFPRKQKASGSMATEIDLPPFRVRSLSGLTRTKCKPCSGLLECEAGAEPVSGGLRRALVLARWLVASLSPLIRSGWVLSVVSRVRGCARLSMWVRVLCARLFLSVFCCCDLQVPANDDGSFHAFGQGTSGTVTRAIDTRCVYLRAIRDSTRCRPPLPCSPAGNTYTHWLTPIHTIFIVLGAELWR